MVYLENMNSSALALDTSRKELHILQVAIHSLHLLLTSPFQIHHFHSQHQHNLMLLEETGPVVLEALKDRDGQGCPFAPSPLAVLSALEDPGHLCLPVTEKKNL